MCGLWTRLITEAQNGCADVREDPMRSWMQGWIVAVAGLMVAAGAQAQQGRASKAQASRYVIVGEGCPGQLKAQQQSIGGATMWVTALEDKDKKDLTHAPSSMGVHVEFESAKTPARSAELSVSYMAAGMRVMPVTPGASAKGPQELKKTFALAAEDKDRVEGDLMVGPASMIKDVHLISVTFADGSVWRAPNENACTIEPNRVLPVDKK
jgi:hypothetical protein